MCASEWWRFTLQMQSFIYMERDPFLFSCRPQTKRLWRHACLECEITIWSQFAAKLQLLKGPGWKRNWYDVLLYNTTHQNSLHLLPVLCSFPLQLFWVSPWWTSLVLPGDKVVCEQGFHEQSRCNGSNPANALLDRCMHICIQSRQRTNHSVKPAFTHNNTYNTAYTRALIGP